MVRLHECGFECGQGLQPFVYPDGHYNLTEEAKPKIMKIGGKEFKYIGDEEYRTYVYGKDGHTYTLTITEPEWLRITESGSHRVVDKKGKAFYLPQGPMLIEWNNRTGTERVNF